MTAKAKKDYDCVGTVRQIRDRIGAKMARMSPDERVKWLNTREYSDPILRRYTAKRDGMAPSPPEPRACRVYVDTSVFRGCESKMFQATSLRLFERFRDGDISLVLSALVARELDSASEAVRAVLGPVPPEHLEFLEPSADAEQLADRYIDAGAVEAEMRPVALHVAFATLARVDVLASWDYKHLLNFYRLRRFHGVNREFGHPHLEIHEAWAVLGENIVDPNKKGFDCVAFQREQRDRISRKLNTMTREERVDWLCNVEITDPILRRCMERAPRGTLQKANVPPPDGQRKHP